MSNILILDTIGERYGMLPSQVLSCGSTLDITVMDIAMSWHHYQNRKANGQVATDFTTDELQNMLSGVRRG